MLKSPPLYPTHFTPEEIIGPGNMSIFRKFLLIASSPTFSGDYPEKKLNKDIGTADRREIAATLYKLRTNGFYPNGFTKNGKIKWLVAVKSETQVEMEKGLIELEALSKTDMQDIARRGYVKVIKDVTIQAAKDHEINREDVLS